jgi:hypothetical protein
MIEKILEQLNKEIEEDGLDEYALPAKIVSYYAVHGDELTIEDRENLLDYGIEMASDIYESESGLFAPVSYEEMADFNKYWRENSTECAIDRSRLRAFFMTLRDLLHKREELD